MYFLNTAEIEQAGQHCSMHSLLHLFCMFAVFGQTGCSIEKKNTHQQLPIEERSAGVEMSKSTTKIVLLSLSFRQRAQINRNSGTINDSTNIFYSVKSPTLSSTGLASAIQSAPLDLCVAPKHHPSFRIVHYAKSRLLIM